MAFPMMLQLKGTHEGKREKNRGWITALRTQPFMTVGNWSSGRLRGVYCRVEAAGMMLGAQILSCHKE